MTSRRTLLPRLLLAGALLGALGASSGAAASAAPGADDIAGAFESSPVFVDPGAERILSPGEVADLRAEIAESPAPIFIAVVSDAAADDGGGANELLTAIARSTGRPGTYALVAGDAFRAGSLDAGLRDGQAGELASAALSAHRDDGTYVVLSDFIDRVDRAVAAQRSGSESDTGAGTSSTPTHDNDDDGLGAAPFLLGGGAIVLAVFGWRRSKRRRQEALDRRRAEEADRAMLRAEISVLADDVVRLEPDVQLHPEAQSDFDAAVNRYRAAEAALQYADEPLDLVRVERVIDEARYSMDRVRARLDRRPLPEPPATLQHPGRHGEPAVALDERAEPVYVGYPGGFGGGWFGGGGGGGGLFSGLLLGSMLGGLGGFGWGGHGDTTVINNFPDSDAGGDFGGGDFGGGDFGGGDFGGGDFGGGDFGGGGDF